MKGLSNLAWSIVTSTLRGTQSLNKGLTIQLFQFEGLERLYLNQLVSGHSVKSTLICFSFLHQILRRLKVWYKYEFIDINFLKLLFQHREGTEELMTMIINQQDLEFSRPNPSRTEKTETERMNKSSKRIGDCFQL